MGKKLRMVWMLVMVLLFVSSVTGWASGPSPLEQVLAQVPSVAFAEGFFSYADLEGLSALVPGAAGPAEEEAAPDYLFSEGGSAFLRVMKGVSAGQPELTQTIYQYDKVEEAMGLSVFDVTQTAEAGRVPQRLVLMRGAMDTSAVQQALTDKGYQPSDALEGLWCPDGDCGLGTQVDLAARDPGFLFGGLLGARWPVYFGESVLMASQSQGVILAAAQRQPGLLSQEPIRAMVDALSKDLNQVHQLLLISPASIYGDTDTDSPWEGIGLLALAQVDSEEAQQVVMAVYYDDVARAGAAKAALDAGEPDVVLADGRALHLLLDELSAVWEEAAVTPLADGAVLRVALGFPAEKETLTKDSMKQPGLPFSLFSRMLQRADLNWLAALGR